MDQSKTPSKKTSKSGHKGDRATSNEKGDENAASPDRKQEQTLAAPVLPQNENH